MNNIPSTVYTFSQHKSFKYLMNNIDKIFFILIILGIVFTYKNLSGQFFVDVLCLIIFLTILILISNLLIKKLVWKFSIDFNKRTILFFLCKKNDPIQLLFSEIKNIKANGPIIFHCNDRNLYYSTKEYVKTLKILNRIKPIQWGNMCNLFGPEKSIRKKIDENS